MRTALSTLGVVVGMGLASVLVGGTLVMLGLNPLLGVLVGAVLALDIQFYRRGSGFDTAGAWSELADRSRTTRR